MVTLTGDDLWLIGQQASDAVAWRSVDGGATFTEAQRIPRVLNGLNRFFFGGVYGGRLYLEAWRFGSVSTSSLVFDGTSFSAGPRLLPDAAAQGWRPVTFAGRLVYRARIPDNDGALLAFDGQAVSVVLATPIHDVAVHGPDLFALAADGTVLHTVDLATWTPFATAPAGSRSIAVFEGRLHVGTLDSRLYRGPQVVPAARLAVAAGPGGGPAVRVLDPVGGAGAASFLAYDPAFAGGVFVAAGNLDGIGSHEVVTGPGPGGAPHVRTFTADGGSLGPGFLAYDPAFRGGVHVAACDVDGDGRAEVVTAPGPGGAPRVRVFAVSGGPALPITEFLAYDPGFAGGVFVACGDLDGDGRAEIVTAPGAGGAPHVRVWKVAPGPVREVASLFPYDLGLAGGVRVAMGDVDGDLVPELVTVAGPGGATHVRVWRLGPGAAPAEIAGFFAYDPGFTGGASLAVGDVNGDGRAEIAVGAGPGGGPDVRVFTGAGALASSLFAFDPAFRGGVEVAILP
jgi:hypothetical protein